MTMTMTSQADTALTTAAPPDSPGPQRPGPRPLGLQILLGASGLFGAFGALGPMLAGTLPWDSALSDEAEELRREILSLDQGKFMAALAGETQNRLAAMLEGMRRYQNHDYRRDLPAVPVLSTAGSARLLDYGEAGKPAVLVIPSLINRAYILDLTAERSFLRWLAGQGFRPLLVDWGAPGDAESHFGFEAYIGDILTGFLHTAGNIQGSRIPLIGYCMGGTLAVALAALHPGHVAALALLATPWDFHADQAVATRILNLQQPMLRQIIKGAGTIPVDLLQAYFAALDPTQAQRKFAAFARMPADSARARQFVALEDWLNDGVPLAGPLALQVLEQWYGANLPPSGQWRIGDTPIRPERIDVPALIAMPRGDRIVPAASSQALADALPQAHRLHPDSGHIGMVVGSGAIVNLWSPLGDWLREVSSG